MQEKVTVMTEVVFKFYPQVRKFFKGFVSIKSLPISMTQLVTLHTIEEQGSSTMSRLAELLQMSNQQLTKVVDALVELDMVTRIIDPHNRRQILVGVSPKGTKTLANLRYEIDKKIGILTSKMPVEEFDKLYDSLMTLNNYFDKLQSVLDKKNT